MIHTSKDAIHYNYNAPHNCKLRTEALLALSYPVFIRTSIHLVMNSPYVDRNSKPTESRDT
jgi:hypothetical protein